MWVSVCIARGWTWTRWLLMNGEKMGSQRRPVSKLANKVGHSFFLFWKWFLFFLFFFNTQNNQGDFLKIFNKSVFFSSDQSGVRVLSSSELWLIKEAFALMTEVNSNCKNIYKAWPASQFGHFWNIGDRPGQPTVASMPPSPSLPHLDRLASPASQTLVS